MLRAALLVMQADYICPEPAVFIPVDPHVAAYLPSLSSSAAGSFEQLATILMHCLSMFHSSALPAESFSRAKAAAGLLAGPASRAAVSRQLEQLEVQQPASQLPLTLQQLKSACCWLVVDGGNRALPDFARAVAMPEADRRSLQAVKDSSLHAAMQWLELDPASLKARTVTVLSRGTRETLAPGSAGLQRLQQALRLAQQQHSPYWVARIALAIVTTALRVPLEAGDLRTVINTFDLAEPAIRGCERLLPHAWVQTLRQPLHVVDALLLLLRSRLSVVESNPHLTPLDAFPAGEAAAAARQEESQRLFAVAAAARQKWIDAFNCSACGRDSVGLRACSRCRAVHYCSRECQVAHWPQHKRNCRPA